MADPELQPDPLAPTPETCHADECSADEQGHWQRRLTEAEIAAETAAYEADGKVAPQPHEFTYLVHACGDHCISIDAATLIHQADCPGPNSSILPDCGCTPEKPPERPAFVPPALPAHWVAAMAAGG